MRGRALVAAVGCLLVAAGFGACGDDDEEGASKESYCAIEEAIDARFGEAFEAIGDDASDDEVDAALQKVAEEIIDEHEDDARAAAPDEISDDVDALFDAAHEVADGDAAAFDTPAVDAAGTNVDEFCGFTDDEGDGASGNELRITETDYAFAVEGTPTAGTLSITVANQGSEMHEIAMGKLVAGKSVDDVRSALETAGEDDDALAGILEEDTALDDLGGLQQPGTGYTITGSGIEAGDYALLCFLPDAEGQPHFSLGMLAPLTIAEGEATDAPEASATYTATDDELEGPETLPAGETTIELINDSSINRELVLVKVKDGKTVQDADAWFSEAGDDLPDVSTTPLEFFAFVFDAEQDRAITTDLTPGTWVLVTPDPENQFEGSVTEDPNAVIITVT